MNIVLTCINNFQEYILLNIKQLLRLGNKNIYVLTNRELFHHFQEYTNITLIDINILHDRYDFMQKCNMDRHFRGGFWVLVSMRFFYIYAFMVQYNIENIIHIENDVLLYYNCDILQDTLNKNYVYVPFDNMKRNIASIMFIPNTSIFEQILDNYSPHQTDMDNFANIRDSTGLIKNFPIFCDENSSDSVVSYVSQNYNQIRYIFDAAAIGQYFGGIDPRNNPNFYSECLYPINNEDCMVGFINESCVITFDKYIFLWKTDTDNCKKPFIVIDDIEIPIFNLHIHSKKLEKFM